VQLSTLAWVACGVHNHKTNMPFEVVAVNTVTGRMKNYFASQCNKNDYKVDRPTRKTYATASDQK